MLKKAAFLTVVLAYFIFQGLYSIEDSPVVRTKSGKVQGLVSVSRDGRQFYEFLGIPYAKAPVGALRYEPPEAPEKWESVRLTQRLGAQCAQVNVLFFEPGIAGAEDCLFLNVFTPTLEPKEKLPVIVFIHGGIFICGSSNMYRPDYFMDENVVLVTINYRLGSLGFLSTGDSLVPGNMGLKDQVKALEWVQDNIAEFGGDPRRVTIVGESAGGVSVHFHMLSPMSKGTFSRGISQSGTALGSWAIKPNPWDQTKRHARQMKCPTENTKDMMACLRAKPIQDILETHTEVLDPFYDQISFFGPTIETGNEGKAFISEKPSKLIRSGQFNRVPWMAGLNSHDGEILSSLIVREERCLEAFHSNFTALIPNYIFYTAGDSRHKAELMGKVRDFYFGKDQRIDSFEKFPNYTNLITDWVFGVPLSEALKAHSQFAPAHAYYYTYHGEGSATDFMLALKGKYPNLLEALIYVAKYLVNRAILGIGPMYQSAAHGDELTLLFKVHEIFRIRPSSKDYVMSKEMIRTWTAFARNEKMSFMDKDWPPVGKDDTVMQFMRLGRNPELIPEPNTERLQFWRENAKFT